MQWVPELKGNVSSSPRSAPAKGSLVGSGSQSGEGGAGGARRALLGGWCPPHATPPGKEPFWPAGVRRGAGGTQRVCSWAQGRCRQRVLSWMLAHPLPWHGGDSGASLGPPVLVQGDSGAPGGPPAPGGQPALPSYAAQVTQGSSSSPVRQTSRLGRFPPIPIGTCASFGRDTKTVLGKRWSKWDQTGSVLSHGAFGGNGFRGAQTHLAAAQPGEYAPAVTQQCPACCVGVSGVSAARCSPGHIPEGCVWPAVH